MKYSDVELFFVATFFPIRSFGSLIVDETTPKRLPVEANIGAIPTKSLNSLHRKIDGISPAATNCAPIPRNASIASAPDGNSRCVTSRPSALKKPFSLATVIGRKFGSVPVRIKISSAAAVRAVARDSANAKSADRVKIALIPLEHFNMSLSRFADPPIPIPAQTAVHPQSELESRSSPLASNFLSEIPPRPIRTECLFGPRPISKVSLGGIMRPHLRAWASNSFWRHGSGR